MLKVFVNPLDNLKEKNGVFKCRLCVQSFSNQDVAINHIKTEHEQIDLIDTDDSASDASVNENSTSGESDGSSGDEESEIQTNSDHDGDVAFSVNNINNNNNNNSRKRAARPLHTSITHDSNEQIHVKICISNVVNELRKIHRISTETLKWTTES